MTIYDEAWVAAEEAKRAWMDANGLYKAEDEHSSCGVGSGRGDQRQAVAARWWRTASPR